MEDVKRVKTVAPIRGRPHVLRIVWRDGGTDVADMTGVVHRLKAFTPLHRSPRLPRPVASMLRTMRDNPAVLAAHYRPKRVRPRGRPKKNASASLVSGQASATVR